MSFIAKLREMREDLDNKLIYNLPLRFTVLIGEGSFSNVYSYKWNSQDVAVKVFKNNIPESKLLKIAERLRGIIHEYIVMFKGYSFRPCVIAYNLCCASIDGNRINTLSDLLETLNSFQYFMFIERVNYAFQMTSGLDYLHKLAIVHRDIKPRNFLVSGVYPDITVKICDFDDVVVLKETMRATATLTDGNVFKGTTFCYLAPEVILGICRVLNFKTDIYALANIMFEIFSRTCNALQSVIPILSDNIIVEAIKEKKRPITDFTHFNEPKSVDLISNLLKRMWAENPDDRPTINEVFKIVENNAYTTDIGVRQKYFAMLRKNDDSPKLSVVKVNDYIGYGVFAMKDFEKDEFLVEIHGELITDKEGKERKHHYEKQRYGSYLYFFEFQREKYCVDSTFSSRIAKWINYSPQEHSNSALEIVEMNYKLRLALVALKYIQAGSEIRFNINDDDTIWKYDESTKKPFKLNISDISVCSEKSETTEKINMCASKHEHETSNLYLQELNSEKKYIDSSSDKQKKYNVVTRSQVKISTFEEESFRFIEKNDKMNIAKFKIDDTIGYGVFALEDIKQDSFVVQYKGKLLPRDDGVNKETLYSQTDLGSFLYFFEHNHKKY